MIELLGTELSAPEHDDRTLCQQAFEASHESKPLLPVNYLDSGFFVDADRTPRVLKGLAKVSLMPPGTIFNGISQAHADYIIGDLSGDVEEFFGPILQQAA